VVDSRRKQGNGFLPGHPRSAFGHPVASARAAGKATKFRNQGLAGWRTGWLVEISPYDPHPRPTTYTRTAKRRQHAPARAATDRWPQAPLSQRLLALAFKLCVSNHPRLLLRSLKSASTVRALSRLPWGQSAFLKGVIRTSRRFRMVVEADDPVTDSSGQGQTLLVALLSIELGHPRDRAPNAPREKVALERRMVHGLTPNRYKLGGLKQDLQWCLVEANVRIFLRTANVVKAAAQAWRATKRGKR